MVKKHQLAVWIRFLYIFVFVINTNTISFCQIFNINNYSTIVNKDKGLSDEYIMCMTQDSSGFIWIGTRTGLCRFDGENMKTWYKNKPNESSLSNNWIVSLYYEQDNNRLWVGTAKGLNVLDLDSGVFISPKLVENNGFDITKEWITGIFRDNNDEFWLYNIGFHNFDVVKNKLNTIQNNFNTNSNTITLVINDVSNSDILWLATMDGYVKFDIKLNTFIGHYFYKDSDRNRQNKLNQIELCLYQHDDGKIYGGAINGGMTILDPKKGVVKVFKPKWGNWNFSDELHYKSVIRINKDLLYIGTNDGIILYNPTIERIVNFIPTSRFQGKTITPYFKDRNNRIWISSSLGIEIYDPYFDQFEIFNYETDIMPENIIATKVIEDTSRNCLYFIQSSGHNIYEFSLNTNTYEIPKWSSSIRGGINNLSTVDIIFNSRGELILLTKDDILKKSNDDWKSFTSVPKLDFPPFNSIVKGLNGELIVMSVYNGMYRINESAILQHYDSSYFHGTGWWLKDAKFDSNDLLWVNHLNEGYSIFDFGNDSCLISYLDNNNPIKIPRVKDEIWLNDTLLLVCGGKDGLGLIKRQKPLEGVFKKFVNGENSLVTDKIYSLEKDIDGNIWMLGDIGIQKYNPKKDIFSFFSYPNPDFIIMSDANDQHILKRLNNGKMVFSCNKGLVFFNPATLWSNKEIVTPIITEVRLFDKIIDPNKYKSKVLQFDSDENYLNIKFSSIGFTLPDKKVFKYRLVGAESEWGEITNIRQIKYANLKSGNYKFELMSANSDRIWGKEIAKISFFIAKPWYARWWAILIYVFSLISMFLIWYSNKKNKWKLKTEIEVHKEHLRTLNKQKELDIVNAMISGEEKERIRLSRELHDSVGAMIASIKMYFESFSREKPELNKDNTFSKTKTLITKTYQEVRNISHNLMPIDVYELGLQGAIRDLCYGMNEHSKLNIKCQFYTENLDVSNEVQVNLFRITQEVLKNIIVHANAKNILLQLNINEDYIHLEVENDGDIFDVEKALAKKSLGLKNILNRVKFIKGELDISSDVKSGTIYSIIIPKRK